MDLYILVSYFSYSTSCSSFFLSFQFNFSAQLSIYLSIFICIYVCIIGYNHVLYARPGFWKLMIPHTCMYVCMWYEQLSSMEKKLEKVEGKSDRIYGISVPSITFKYIIIRGILHESKSPPFSTYYLLLSIFYTYCRPYYYHHRYICLCMCSG